MEELMQINNSQVEQAETEPLDFIHANTKHITLEEISRKCIIPVFAKDNETTVSHNEFIQAVGEVTSEIFAGEAILGPSVKVSHPVKGRIPEAMGKPVNLLEDHEKTIYFERMAFMYELPGIHENIEGNRLNLTVGGVRAYNQENLFSKKSAEKFKVFIGHQNMVCLNLCISTDGLSGEVKVSSIGQLMEQVYNLLVNYNAVADIRNLESLPGYSLSEDQFAHMLGRIRMYHHMPPESRKNIPALMIGDSQVGSIVREYYRDPDFKVDPQGNIDLWSLYNLFTGANKSSYIDTFLSRGVNALDFVKQIQSALRGEVNSWYLQS